MNKYSKEVLKLRTEHLMHSRMKKMSFEEAQIYLEGIKRGKDGEIIYPALCSRDWEECRWPKRLNIVVQDNLVTMSRSGAQFPDYIRFYSKDDVHGLYSNPDSVCACLGHYYTGANDEAYFEIAHDNIEKAEHILLEAKWDYSHKKATCSLFEHHAIWQDVGWQERFERRILPVNLSAVEATDNLSDLKLYNALIEQLRGWAQYVTSSQAIIGQPLYGGGRDTMKIHGCDEGYYNLINTVWRGKNSLRRTYVIALNGQKIKAVAKEDYDIPPLFHQDLLQQYAEFGWINLPLNTVAVEYRQDNLVGPPIYSFLHQPSQGCSVAEIERLKLLEQKLQNKRRQLAEQHEINEERLQPGITWTSQLSFSKNH